MEVVTFGETVALLSAPEGRRLGNISSLSVGIGGAESNVAIALSRLGIACTWMGRVGADSFGDLVVREIPAEGVHVVAHRDDTGRTAVMVKEHPSGRPCRIWYYRHDSAASRLTPQDLDEGEIAAAGVFHLTGITAGLGPGSLWAVRWAIEVARLANTLVSFDVNYRASLWSVHEASPVLRDLVARSHIVFAGLTEAALVLSGTPAAPAGNDPWMLGEKLAHEIAALGPTRVVIKLGSHGALSLCDGEVHRADAHRVTVIDPVGAGDAFVGGYLSELVHDRPAATCLRTGNRLGALVCAARGDWEGLPDRYGLDGLEADGEAER